MSGNQEAWLYTLLILVISGVFVTLVVNIRGCDEHYRTQRTENIMRCLQAGNSVVECDSIR